MGKLDKDSVKFDDDMDQNDLEDGDGGSEGDLEDGDEDQDQGGDGDGFADGQDKTNKNYGSKQKKISDKNKGTDDQGDGEEDGDNGQDVGEDEGSGGEELDERDQEIANLKAEIEEIKKGVNGNQQQQQQQQHQFSEEEKAAISERAGMSWQSVQFINNAMVNTMKSIQQYVESKLGDFTKTSALDSFAKNPKFADAQKYRQGIEEYLATIPAAQRGDPKHIEIGYYLALGKAVKSGKKSSGSSSQDKGKKIIVSGTRPRLDGKPQGRSQALSEMDRRIAKSAGMSDKEFAYWRDTKISDLTATKSR